MRRGLAVFWRKAYKDGITGLAGMVAYNLLLSIFPLALVALFVAARVLDSEEVIASIVADLRQIFPSATDATLQDGLRRLRDASTTSGVLAVVAAVWLGSSFWGSLDTAFCRIYRRPCRSWVRQKLFALGMLVVVIMFMAATVVIPIVQSVLSEGAQDLPFGLDRGGWFVYFATLIAGLLLLFVALCAIYWRVPKGAMPWRGVWPGATFATVAITAVDYAFPLYLSNVSTLQVGSTLLFVLIVLIWFYVLALILLAGAVLNELRLESTTPSPTPSPPRPREAVPVP
jgi:YihY family inner membrane protein